LRRINRNSRLECYDAANTPYDHPLADCELGMASIPSNNRARRIFACSPEKAYAAAVARWASEVAQNLAQEMVAVIVGLQEEFLKVVAPTLSSSTKAKLYRLRSQARRSVSLLSRCVASASVRPERHPVLSPFVFFLLQRLAAVGRCR
jgi:hypothetical protein